MVTLGLPIRAAANERGKLGPIHRQNSWQVTSSQGAERAILDRVISAATHHSNPSEVGRRWLFARISRSRNHTHVLNIHMYLIRDSHNDGLGIFQVIVHDQTRTSYTFAKRLRHPFLRYSRRDDRTTRCPAVRPPSFVSQGHEVTADPQGRCAETIPREPDRLRR